MEQEKKEKESLAGSILALQKIVNQLQLRQYLQLEDNPKKFLFYNFIVGIIRGLGFAIGVSLIFALILWILTQLIIIPIVGDWIVDLLNYIERVKLY